MALTARELSELWIREQDPKQEWAELQLLCPGQDLSPLKDQRFFASGARWAWISNSSSIPSLNSSPAPLPDLSCSEMQWVHLILWGSCALPRLHVSASWWGDGAYFSHSKEQYKQMHKALSWEAGGKIRCSKIIQEITCCSVPQFSQVLPIKALCLVSLLTSLYSAKYRRCLILLQVLKCFHNADSNSSVPVF